MNEQLHPVFAEILNKAGGETMTEAAEYKFNCEQYMDVKQLVPIEEKLGRAVDKFRAAFREVSQHLDVITVDIDKWGKMEVLCTKASFFEVFTIDEVDYESRETCGTYPHQYFVLINGAKFLCITEEEVNG